MEQDWLAAVSIHELMQHLPPGAEGRRLRLFACAACRTLNHVLLPEGQALLAAAEEYADDLIGRSMLYDAREDASAPKRYARTPAIESTHLAVLSVAWGAAPSYRVQDTQAVTRTVQLVCEARRLAGWQKGDVELAVLLRDIFGNPFRPVAFDPTWRTGTAVELARGMYEAREFAAMPILADALQDAGCDNEDVLTHCRGPGPHVRGCWVVDLVLGKG
jgi:hypothetical protein